MTDVIVIGAGAAGCALAYRLSLDPGTSVLLLEAGPDQRPDEVAVPARWSENREGPLDYNYWTVPQPATAGRVHPVPRGRVLGGSTSINAMIHALPSPEDFVAWGYGWEFDLVKPVLSAMERHWGGAATGRGESGPVANGTPKNRNELCAAFVEACVQQGFPALDDVNAPSARGVGWFDLSIDEDGSRADAAQAYIRPVFERANLDVWPNTTATSLIFKDGRVTTVLIRRNGADEELEVTGQVVLSAGTVDSPALLLRSGVGPRRDVIACGGVSVLDLDGVGANLHDHPLLPVIWSTNQVVAPPRNQFAEAELLLRGEQSIGGQDLSIAFAHVALVPPDFPPVLNGATALIGLYRPYSRGSLRLDPSDPEGPPLIDPGYLTDARDLDALVAAVRLVRTTALQPALKAYCLEEIVPGPPAAGDEQLADFARQAVSTFGHPVGTCAMGNNAQAVVDQQLRVRGSTNLRIADASVIPRIPGVAPSVTTQMIGWRCAEMMLES